MTNGILRRAGVGALATLLALLGLIIPLAGSAGAAQGFNCTRLAGNDRYETAAAIATATFPNGAETVLLATGEKFPDALAGNFLAGNRNAPILLTPTAALAPSTRTAIQTLKAKNVIILGREEAVSTAVENDLRDENSANAAGGTLTVTRIGGTDRYETAALIATAANTTVGSVDGKRTAIIARGNAFPDALAAGPGAFAAKLPILLTPGADEGTAGTTLHPSAKAALQSLQIEAVIITGGEQAVSASTETDAKNARSPQTTITATRLGGADRTETARLIGEFFIQKLGFSTSKVNIARGDDFPDALTGGPHAGTEKAVILLTVGPSTLSAESSGLGTGARRFLQEHANTLTGCHIFGGEQAVSAAVESEIETLGGAPASGATVNVSNSNVQRGGNVSGSITGQNIQNVVVQGPCINQTTLTPSSTSGQQTINFSIPVNANAAAGNCTLTFTTTFTNGSTETDTVNLTVAAPASGATATARPELVSATIVDTFSNNNIQTTCGATGTGTPFNQTRVRYTFDEPVTGGLVAGAAALFHLVGNDPDLRYNGQCAVIESTTSTPTGGSTSSVLVTFGVPGNATGVLATPATPDAAQGGQVGATQLQNIAVATVDAGAVTDNQGLTNPIGDAGVGSGGSTGAAQAGVTAAPDLQSVGSFTVNQANTAQTFVTFTFDEAAFTVDPNGFHLISIDGLTDTICTAVPGATGGFPAAGAAGSNTIVVNCPNVASFGTFSATNVARGYVEPATVSDNQLDQNAAGNAAQGGCGTAAQDFDGGGADTTTGAACQGNVNPLQASDNPDQTTATPDLQSAQFFPGATAADQDAVAFVFDEPVLLGAGVAPGTTVGSNLFCVYGPNGNELCSTTATRSTTNANAVLVTFGTGTTLVETANGANVRQGAVIDQDNSQINQEDEVGVTNSNSSTVTPGVTDGPDLVTIRLEVASRDPFTQAATAYRAIFVFDEALANPQPAGANALNTAGDFTLYNADGTAVTCNAGALTFGTAADSGTNTVRCTAFSPVGAQTQAQANLAAGNLVAGTVDNASVFDADQNNQNPEGYAVTTGGTGTAQQ